MGNNFTTNVETCQQHILAMLNGAPLNGKLVSKIIAVLISDTGGGGGGGNNYDMFASGNQKSTFGNVSTLIPYDGPIFVTAIKALVTFSSIFYS